MSQKFQASVQHRGDVSYVKLGGVIDEDNELNDLVDKIPAGTAVIDLGEIERINSCGVRDWVNWLSKLESNGTRSVLVECSPAIVAQINLVNNFTGNGVVKSFYVPYFCPECDEEKVLLVEAADMGAAPHEPPTCRCDECDLVMDFDDMPDSYFAFLANQKKVAEADVDASVKEMARGSDTGAKAKVKSRASLPNLGGPASSAPSVPSLPSIQKTSTQPAKTTSSGPRLPTTKQTSSNPGSKPSSSSVPPAKQSSNPLLQAKSPSTPNMSSAMSMRMAAGPPVAAPGKSNALVFTLIGVLIAAIAVLAYVVLTK
jgi:anti-anti-sigma regulatory factor